MITERFLSITYICEIVLELLIFHYIIDGTKRRAYATSAPNTRDHPLQEITHYKRSPITRDHPLQEVVVMRCAKKQKNKKKHKTKRKQTKTRVNFFGSFTRWPGP